MHRQEQFNPNKMTQCLELLSCSVITMDRNVGSSSFYNFTGSINLLSIHVHLKCNTVHVLDRVTF